jgi:hypothetical protein
MVCEGRLRGLGQPAQRASQRLARDFQPPGVAAQGKFCGIA